MTGGECREVCWWGKHDGLWRVLIHRTSFKGLCRIIFELQLDVRGVLTEVLTWQWRSCSGGCNGAAACQHVLAVLIIGDLLNAFQH